MRKTMTVRECMSHLPVEADRVDPLGAVLDQMRAHRCHHVPVMDGPRLFGILSREDLHEHALRAGAAWSKTPAGEVCIREPLVVSPVTPVVDVARAMLERRVASALIVDGDVLVGIFTSRDALQLLAGNDGRAQR